MLPLLSFIRPKKKIHDGRYVDFDACQCRKRHTNKICAVPSQEDATVCTVEETHGEPRPAKGHAVEQQGKQQGQDKERGSSPKAITRQPANEEDTKAEGSQPKWSLPREDQGIIGCEDQGILPREDQGILGCEDQGILGCEDQGILGCEVQTSQTQGLLPTTNKEVAQSGDANTSALGYEGPNPYAQYIPPGYQPPPQQNYGNQPPNLYGNQPPNLYGNQPPPGYGGQPNLGHGGQGQPHGANSMQLGYSYNSPPQQAVGGYEPPPGYSIQEAVTSPYQNPQAHIIYVFQHPSPHQPQSQRQSHASELPIQEATTTVIYVLPKPLEDPQKRREFVRKTYSVLFLQLLFTSLVVAACTLIHPVKAWIASHQYISLIFLFLYVTALILVCMLMPYLLNTNCFSVFVLILLTVAMSGLAGVLTSTKAQEMVLLAAGTTTVVVFVMTVMACICVDFTPFTYIVLVISLIVIAFGFFSMALLPFIPMIKLVYSAVAALLMCVYIIIDTQMIIGGKSHELDTHMYIFGSIMLYLDIILLFFYILDILDS